MTVGLATRVAARYKSKKKTDDGNTVYLYSERQIQHRNREKAKRLEKLESGIKKLRSQVNRDLDAKDDQKRQTALAIALIDATYERVGNPESAKDGHFGVTGWQPKHLTFSGGKATLKYIGKSGVKQQKVVDEASLVTALKAAAEACANDSDALLSETSAEEINAYLEPYDVTAKDLRGFHANRVMREQLQAARKGKLPDDKKKREEKLKDEWKQALEATAEAVGHESATLKNQYLVPGLEDDFLKDGVINEPGSKLARRVARRFIAESFGDPRVYLNAMETVLNRQNEDIEMLPWMRKAIQWITANPDLKSPPASEGVFLYEAVQQLRRYGTVGYAGRIPRLYEKMHAAGGGRVFLALLQQLSFDKALRVKVERGSKFYSKTRSQRPDQKRALDTYEKLIEEYRGHLDTIREAIAKGIPHGADEVVQTKIPAGSFTLINTGGFDDSTMQALVKLTAKAEQLLKQHGYGRVCYGDIHISNTIGRSARILAFYSIKEDEMFVRANLKGKFDEALHTIIHELAHRYEFRKFVDRKQVTEIYRALKHKTMLESSASSKDAPQPGEKLVQKGMTWIVSEVTYTGQGLQVQLVLEEEPKVKGRTSLEGWLRATGKRSTAGAFVTAYAQKDPSENFAEMVAAHCLGTLPQEQVEMLEAII